MKRALLSCVALVLGACAHVHEFDVDPPTRVAYTMPPPASAPGRSNMPYTGKPKYLAAARPLQPTASAPADANPCAQRSRICEDRLRAILASLDGQILALSSPPTALQVSTLRLQSQQLRPLLAPYPDVAAEGSELGGVIDKLPTLEPFEIGPARRRLTELSDLIRVQLAAGE